MELSQYVAELRESLAVAASLGDDTTQRSAAALTAALEPAARLALAHALSDMAAEVTTQLAGGAVGSDRITVDVRLEGKDVRVVAERSWSAETDREPGAGAATGGATGGATEPGNDESADQPRTFAEASGDLTRTTVRMFHTLKGEAEQAAAEQGVSLNSFISRAVADSIRGDKGRRGQRHGGSRHGDPRWRRDSDSSISGYVQG